MYRKEGETHCVKARDSHSPCVHSNSNTGVCVCVCVRGGGGCVCVHNYVHMQRLRDVYCLVYHQYNSIYLSIYELMFGAAWKA